MSHRLVVVVVLVLAAAAAGAAPKVDRRDVGLTFTLPARWKFDLPAGEDHAQMTYADSTRYCIISLYAPIASDDAELDFEREWHAIAGTIKDQTARCARRAARDSYP